MYSSQIFSFLGTICLWIAAIVISSKYAIKPKVRIIAFSSYIGACIFLAIFGAVLSPPDNWMILQQVGLLLVNIRGIRNAVKEIRNGRKNRC